LRPARLLRGSASAFGVILTGSGASENTVVAVLNETSLFGTSSASCLFERAGSLKRTRYGRKRVVRIASDEAKRTTTNTRITASMTAYSAMSWPSSSRLHGFCARAPLQPDHSRLHLNIVIAGNPKLWGGARFWIASLIILILILTILLLRESSPPSTPSNEPPLHPSTLVERSYLD
jgi:hypothetical protein